MQITQLRCFLSHASSLKVVKKEFYKKKNKKYLH